MNCQMQGTFMHIRPWFLELVSLWNILHWLWKPTFSWGFHGQNAVSVVPLCSPQAGLSLLCSALPVSHTHLIQVTPLTCFQSVWLYKDCCPPHTRCQSVLCVQDALVLLPLNSGFALCVFLTSELGLSPGYSLSLLSPKYWFCVCPPGFSLPVPVAVWFPALFSLSVFDPTGGFLLKTDFLFFFLPSWFCCKLQSLPTGPVCLLCWILNTL